MGTAGVTYKTCSCQSGWGASTDIAYYKAPDCSMRICPSGKTFASVPTGEYTAHEEAECSNNGICDRSLGECTCFEGFDGNACQRLACPEACSGHGQCLSMRAMASMSNAFPLSKASQTNYNDMVDTKTWDSMSSFGCICDSSWDVGLSYNERQLSEWFGPGCEFRRCPSGNDPITPEDDE